jgi:hypothetical protein
MRLRRTAFWDSSGPRPVWAISICRRRRSGKCLCRAGTVTVFNDGDASANVSRGERKNTTHGWTRWAGISSTGVHRRQDGLRVLRLRHERDGDGGFLLAERVGNIRHPRKRMGMVFGLVVHGIFERRNRPRRNCSGIGPCHPRGALFNPAMYVGRRSTSITCPLPQLRRGLPPREALP